MYCSNARYSVLVVTVLNYIIYSRSFIHSVSRVENSEAFCTSNQSWLRTRAQGYTRYGLLTFSYLYHQ